MQVRLCQSWDKALGLLVLLAGMLVGGHAAWAWQPEVVGGRCKSSGQSCRSTIGNAGGQGACCDPLQRDVANCAQSNACTGGRPYRWPTNSYAQGLQWYFNPNNMPGQGGYQGLSETQVLNAIKAGWDAWAKQTCTSFKHKYVGKDSSFPSYNRPDNKNLMFLAAPSQWAQMGAGASTLAFTVPVTDRNGVLVDSDIVFNPSPGGRAWKIGNGAGRHDQDIIHVAAHEIGHAIGFGHSVQQQFLMYFASRPGPFPGLHQDDVNGLCTTYPKTSCNADADCGSGTCLSCQNSQCKPKPVTLAPKSCKPCNSPSDCGNTASNICVRLQEGNRCAQLCNNDGCCPNGYRCADFGIQKACIPDGGTCPPVSCGKDSDCGPGESCQGSQCKPKPVSRHAKTCTTCSSDADCGSGNKCVTFSDSKNRCLQPCVADNFCPPNFVCSSTLGGRYCTPPDGFCPCSNNSQCIQGEACKGGACRPASCKYGCRCTENSHCDTGYQCFQTQDGGICVKPCGSSAAFPAGSAGGPCRSDDSCGDGAQCYRLSGSQNICMRPCSSSSNCTYGGQCFRLGPQAFCLCQADSDCRNGQACNKSVLGQFGGGACTTAGSSTQCEPNFDCREVARGVNICMPASTGGPGATCGGTSGGCKDGLQCVRTSQGAQTGTCIEDCSADGNCDEGGQCVLQGGNNTRFCGCANNSQCKTGQTCKLLFGQAGICTGGGSTSNCNNNGTCDSGSGENCSNCAADCGCQNGETCESGVCRSQACGNGTCERDKLEDCGTCAADCKCGTGRVCENSRCVVNTACGNGTCERDKLEDCGTCAADCTCDGGRVCQNSRCVNPPQSCGNGTCEPGQQEDCGTCPQDCACGDGKTCDQNRCVDGTSNNNNTNTNNPGDGGTTSDANNPPPETCGCEANGAAPLSTLLLVGLMLLWLVNLRRRLQWGRPE